MSNDKKYIEERQIVPNFKVQDIAKRDEKHIIALILQNKELLEDALETSEIGFKHFLSKANAGMFAYIARYWDRHRALLTRDAFRSAVEEIHNEQETARFMMMFNEYLALRVNPEDWSKLKEGLLNRYVQQQFFEAIGGGEAFTSIVQSTTEQSRKVSQLLEKLSGIDFGMNIEDGYSRTVDLDESLDDLAKTLEARRTESLRDRGLLCGINAFDDRFYGFRKGKYGVFLGFPNGGKTTMMINFASNMAKIGYKVCYVTIESDDEEISERILSKESGISGNILKKGGTEIGGLTDDVMNNVLHTMDQMKATVGKNLTYITVPQKTPLSDIFARIERKRKFVDFNVVFVDYLDVIGHANRHQGRPDLDLAETSVELQAWGRQRGIFVWTAQSIKNEKIKEFRKKDWLKNPEESMTQVGVEDAGGSQKLSRDPDYVISMVPHPDGDKLVIFVTKSRYDCPAGTRWICDWDKGCCTITDHEEFRQSGNAWQRILKAPGDEIPDEFVKEATAEA